MAVLGKSIELYLMDGNADGRWQAALSNWNAQAYKIPRNLLQESDTESALHSPGVYFLFGWDDDEEKQFVYIGEGDDALTRIGQRHSFENNKTYWTEAVIFVTPDGTLEKSRVKYLENRFHKIAVDAKRFIVKNGNTPSQSPLNRQVRDLLEAFIINAEVIMSTLGYKVFELSPSVKPERNDDLLYFSRNGGKSGKGTGILKDGRFWLLKGSYIYPEIASYVSSGIRKSREKYQSLISSEHILQEDISFGSPSYAAPFLCGKNSNGLSEWKNDAGIPLGKLENLTDQPEVIDIPEEQENKPEKEQMLFHIIGKKVQAEGILNESGFKVLKGSHISQKIRRSCPSHVKKLRDLLIKDGVVQDYTFSEDYVFKTPSGAAACVLGGSANGNISWVDKDGKTLGECR